MVSQEEIVSHNAAWNYNLSFLSRLNKRHRQVLQKKNYIHIHIHIDIYEYMYLHVTRQKKWISVFLKKSNYSFKTDLWPSWSLVNIWEQLSDSICMLVYALNNKPLNFTIASNWFHFGGNEIDVNLSWEPIFLT